MRIDIRKTNPTKYRFGMLCTTVTLAHAVAFVVRNLPPVYKDLIEKVVPFEFISLLALASVVVWALGVLLREWKALQASLLMMTAFYSAIASTLIYSGLYNGAIMWIGAVFVCLFTYNMKPVELLRGSRGQ